MVVVCVVVMYPGDWGGVDNGRGKGGGEQTIYNHARFVVVAVGDHGCGGGDFVVVAIVVVGVVGFLVVGVDDGVHNILAIFFRGRYIWQTTVVGSVFSTE